MSMTREGRTMADKGLRLVEGFNRVLYAAFVLFGAYWLVRGEAGEAFSMIGIALIFDPFDTEQSWHDRPAWQRAWLIGHLVVLTFVGGMAISEFLR